MKRRATTERWSTRERVLDAALASFAQRGYEATSLDALAAGLGVRKQTILYYHPSKEVLLSAVVERAATELGQVLVDGGGRPEAVIDAVLRLGAARPELLALVREVVRLGPPVSTGLLDRLEPLIARAGARLGRDPHPRHRGDGRRPRHRGGGPPGRRHRTRPGVAPPPPPSPPRRAHRLP